jgi:hypothetical protein
MVIKCKNCETKEAIKYSKYSTGEFCSRECSRSYSTKFKRDDINAKVSKKLKGVERVQRIEKICPECNNIFYVTKRKKNQLYCSVKCVKNSDIIKQQMSKSAIKRCNSITERKRLKEIGRFGGFGTKGYTNKGVYYQSLYEKNVFEYLDSKCIEYEPHKPLPNSSKISDVYLIGMDLWVELDGINREKKKKWLGKDYDYWLEKLDIYKREKLNYVIINTLDEFKKIIAL